MGKKKGQQFFFPKFHKRIGSETIKTTFSVPHCKIHNEKERKKNFANNITSYYTFFLLALTKS
jgi:hypothetical protein